LLASHAWEQLALPWVARSGFLLNFAGGAPRFVRRQAVHLHDAAVFDHPEAYSRAFVAWYRGAFVALAQRAERVFTVSCFSQQRLAAALGLPRERFVVVPNGGDHLDDVAADESVLERHGLTDRPFLLAVASRNPTKNLARLEAAFVRLHEDSALAGAKLVIVGGVAEQVFAPEHGHPTGRGGAVAEDGVVRTGPLADAPLLALYRRALALVFVSRYEGFGLPVLEAMRCGCPVLASRAPALLEVAREAALYADAEDTGSIADAMRRLVSARTLREDLAAAGRERAGAFTWAAAAAAYVDALPQDVRAVFCGPAAPAAGSRRT
jgi:glycosyltransferase involved in cell wall biosynthesis